MTSAVLTAGAKIGVGDAASPEVFNKVPEVTALSMPQINRPTVDVTNLDSTSKEFISGLTDGGSVELSGNWLSGNTYHQLLKTKATAGTAANYLIELPDSPSTKVEFTATPEAFDLPIETDAAINFTITLKVSGTPDWTTTNSVTG